MMRNGEQIGPNETETALPELERMLIETAAAQIDSAAASERRTSRRRAWRRFSALGPPRLAAIGLAIALCGGTAMAATGVWEPPIGVLTGAAPPTTSHSPVPAAVTDAFGVLRREQTPKDRSTEVEATLARALFADGIRPGSVRYLAPSKVKGEAVVIFSARLPGEPAERAEQLCFYRPEFAATTEELPNCFTEDTLFAGRAFTGYVTFSPRLLKEERSRGSAADVECEKAQPPAFCQPTKETAVGLAPDGVATVTAKFTAAPDVTVPVHENYFEIPLHGAEISHRPGGVRRVVWRDAEGHVIPQRSIEGPGD
jgi:hypothetical protein